MHHWRVVLKFSSFTINTKTNDRNYLKNQVNKLCTTAWVTLNHRTILAADNEVVAWSRESWSCNFSNNKISSKMWTGQSQSGEDQPKSFEQLSEKFLKYFFSEKNFGQNDPLDTWESALKTPTKFFAQIPIKTYKFIIFLKKKHLKCSSARKKINFENISQFFCSKFELLLFCV